VESIKQFELLEDLHPESQAQAVLLKWNGNSYVKTQEKIVLFDSVRNHGERGDRGYCFFSNESNRWESLSGLYQQMPEREF
jgi:hypothetical protein